MTDTLTPPILDGHNDVLLKLMGHARGREAGDFIGGCEGHVDLPRARKGGFGGGFFAIYVPSPEDGTDHATAMSGARYDLPLPARIGQDEALRVVMRQASILVALERECALEICTTAGQIRSCLNEGRMAAVMHMEGAEAIDADFDALEILYRAGLRSLGPVWSRPTIFGHGVPFRYPSGPDIGAGLSGAGKDLVRQCNRMGIMIDLSHLNEAGFRDVAAISDAPLVATHSNAHAICPNARNLTDWQLDAIADSDGMVGINFATAFLRPDGQMRADTPVDVILRHLDHLIGRLGEDRVGFGSDFDGAMIPESIGDVAGLPVLRSALIDHGIDRALMKKLCHDNWLRVLEVTWGN